MVNVLFRGISKEKFEKDGKIIKPSISGAFESIIFMDEGHNLDEGFNCDESETNSVIKHQKDSSKYPTSGISTTPIYERAKFYATDGGKKDGFIFVIDRDRLKDYKIKEFNVDEIVSLPKEPEDKEVLLYVENGKELPIELVIRTEEVII